MNQKEKDQDISHVDSLDNMDINKSKKKRIKNYLLMFSPFCLIILAGIYVLFFYRQSISAFENKAKLQDTSIFSVAQNLQESLADYSDAVEVSIAQSVLENSAEQESSAEGADLPDSDLEGSDVPDSVQEGSDMPDSVQEGSDVPDSVQEGSDVPDSVQEDSDVPDPNQESSNVEGSNVPDSDLPGDDWTDPALDYDWSSVSSDTYDFSGPVPLSDEVDISYFNDAVLLGDSLTEGLKVYSGIPATSYAYKSLTVRKVFTQDVIEIGGGKMSPMEVLQDTDFNKVYIMLGINETGWGSSSSFIEGYQKVIDEVKRINPEAVIYVQSILPVSAGASAANNGITNERIREYNNLIQKMAEENRIYYVNVAESMVQADGCLPDDASTDGIHPKKSYYNEWLVYLQTHTVAP